MRYKEGTTSCGCIFEGDAAFAAHRSYTNIP